jgi:hypothetical protein
MSHLMVSSGWLKEVATWESLRTRVDLDVWAHRTRHGSLFDGLECLISHWQTCLTRENSILSSVLNRGVTKEQLLVLSYVRQADHKGSDVRLDTGDFLTPKAWPRQCVEVASWRWHDVVQCKGRWVKHASELEMRAGFSALRWRTRSSNKKRVVVTCTCLTLLCHWVFSISIVPHLIYCSE